MSYGKVTSKFQTTIPKNIRKQLNINAGDVIVFETHSDGSIIIRKLIDKKNEDYNYLRSIEATLQEWNSKEDDECFKDLQSL